MGAIWLIVAGAAAWAAPPPQSKTCSPHQAEAADAMVDHLTDWAQVEVAFKKFAQCDDGSIAEGNSEAVVRLLADHWQTLVQLDELIRKDQGLKRFVLRHIDSTVNTEDLDKIGRLSASSCPRDDLAALCKEIHAAALSAGR